MDRYNAYLQGFFDWRDPLYQSTSQRLRATYATHFTHMISYMIVVDYDHQSDWKFWVRYGMVCVITPSLIPSGHVEDLRRPTGNRQSPVHSRVSGSSKTPIFHAADLVKSPKLAVLQPQILSRFYPKSNDFIFLRRPNLRRHGHRMSPVFRGKEQNISPPSVHLLPK